MLKRDIFTIIKAHTTLRVVVSIRAICPERVREKNMNFKVVFFGFVIKKAFRNAKKFKIFRGLKGLNKRNFLFVSCQ